MIYETFISPTERPTTSLAIKRALLSFDKVHVADPQDRDYFPPQAFAIAMGMPPIFGFNMGPVRPLGKVPGYDAAFDQTMSEVDRARREGLVDIVASYDRTTSDQFTLGAVLLGDYPLNPNFLLWAYRTIGRDNDVLTSAIADDRALFDLPDEMIGTLGLANCRADGGINDDPALPVLVGSLAREHLRETLSNIARARVASVIKSIGLCVSKKMIPFFDDAPYGAVAGRIAARANDVIDRVSEHDPLWAGRAQVLRIAHEEYIDDEILQRMPIDHVLQLRTKAWGEQASAREEMLWLSFQRSYQTNRSSRTQRGSELLHIARGRKTSNVSGLT